MYLNKIKEVLSTSKRVVLENNNPRDLNVRWFINDTVIAEASVIGDKYSFIIAYQNILYKSNKPAMVDDLIATCNQNDTVAELEKIRESNILNNIEEVLSKCKRVVLLDRLFNNREVSWYIDDEMIAKAYVGETHSFHYNFNGLIYDAKVPNIVNKFIGLGNRHLIHYNDKE